jgi:hypothetical protein
MGMLRWLQNMTHHSPDAKGVIYDGASKAVWKEGVCLAVPPIAARILETLPDRSNTVSTATLIRAAWRGEPQSQLCDRLHAGLNPGRLGGGEPVPPPWCRLSNRFFGSGGHGGGGGGFAFSSEQRPAGSPGRSARLAGARPRRCGRSVGPATHPVRPPRSLWRFSRFANPDNRYGRDPMNASILSGREYPEITRPRCPRADRV